MSPLRLLAGCALASLLSFASGQQFMLQAAALPGGSLWSEGVEAFDADGDGDLDLVFSNGNGFSSAQGAVAPTLLINQTVPGATTFSFADETAMRIPAMFAQQGKGLTICDVNQDGAPDIVFANGFGNQPNLLMNDGTGVFTDQTAARLPVLSLSAFGVCAPDVDNDGDPDLVFCDTGPSLLGAPGAPPRLLINDGTGNFTEAPMQMNGVNKIGAMQISAADVDNDFDLDIIVDGRSVGQHLYYNDGTGNFTFAGASVLPPGSTLIYETDWADLDFDNDIDGFYISMSSFSEGVVRNNLALTGTVGFSGSTAFIGGFNGSDDNECAFLDADDDGDLDILVASLSGAREKLYRNSGTFGAGSFVYQGAGVGFTTIGDSTLDLAVGDFNADGAYDVVTAQGESGSYLNRIYRNTGPADTRDPRIGRVEALPGTIATADLLAGELVQRAWIQDAVTDSSRNYISASFEVNATKDGITQSFTTPATYGAGGIFRGEIVPQASPTGLVGMQVSVRVAASDPVGNAAVTPYVDVVVCGSEGYGTPSPVNAMGLGASPDPQVGQVFTLSAAGGPAAAVGALVVGANRAAIPAAGGEILVDLTGATLLPVASDAAGTVTVPVGLPPVAALAGILARMQVGLVDATQPGGFTFSTGLDIAICE